MKDISVAGNQPKQQNLIVNQLVQVSVDRTMKTVKDLISSLQTAESIYYPNRSRLLDLYAHVDLDGHLSGIISKRIETVLNKQIQIIDANKKEAEGFDSLLQSEVFRDICKQILMAKFWGLGGMEFVPGIEIEIEEIPRKHIKLEQGVITINQSDYTGKEIDKLSHVWVIGKKNDYGLFLKVAFYALIKKGGFGDYAQYVEIFGQPVRVGKYDANDDATRSELKKALVDAGGSLAIMIPKQAEFEIMDGKSSNANGDLQEKFINACNNEMDVAILGVTETTGNSNGGSNAKAKEQSKQQLEITKSDMAYLLSKLNSNKFKSILRSYNLPINDNLKFVFEKEIDLAHLSSKIIIDTQVAKQGVPIADDYFYETYNIPKPDNYDELKVKKEELQTQKKEEQEPKPQPQPKNHLKTKKKENIKNLSLLDKFRATIADFFDHAHND